MPSRPQLSTGGRRLWVAAIFVSLWLAGPTSARTQESVGPDERAIEVARQALDAIESGWALARYDGAQRVRAAVNVRGGGSTPIGITSNLVMDRTARRWRLDAGGDVGPFTLFADRERMTLFSPDLGQFAQQAGMFTLGDGSGDGLMAQVIETRQRLDRGYRLLRYVGEETINGVLTHRIQDTPAPGTTATYWIDAVTHLPRRAELSRPGRRDVRIEFHYGSGPRPVRIGIYLEGEHDVQTTATLRYDGVGRVSQAHAVSRVGGGDEFISDVNVDWSPGVAAGFFIFDPPVEAQEVPFQQLVSGLLFAAANKLAAILPLVPESR
jgi:hypothetical protein